MYRIALAISLFIIGVSGSLMLMVQSFIGETSFVFLIVVTVFLSVLIWLEERIKLIQVAEVQITLRAMKETESAVRKLAKSVLDVVESFSGMRVTSNFDKENHKKAVDALKKITR